MSGSAYDTLGVPRNAKAAEIREKYLELAKATHPDASGSAALKSGGGFAEISAAYDVLSDPRRRAQHDLDLEQRQRSHAPEVLATALALASRGRVLAATAAFLALEREAQHTSSDSVAKVELARALLDLSANSAPTEPATHAQVAQLWEWLLRRDAVDSRACNDWFAFCLNRGHHIDAMRAYKHAQREGLEQVGRSSIALAVWSPCLTTLSAASSGGMLTLAFVTHMCRVRAWCPRCGRSASG